MITRKQLFQRLGIPEGAPLAEEEHAGGALRHGPAVILQP